MFVWFPNFQSFSFNSNLKHFLWTIVHNFTSSSKFVLVSSVFVKIIKKLSHAPLPTRLRTTDHAPINHYHQLSLTTFISLSAINQIAALTHGETTAVATKETLKTQIPKRLARIHLSTRVRQRTLLKRRVIREKRFSARRAIRHRVRARKSSR